MEARGGFDLTKSDIVSIIHSGIIKESDLARQFKNRIKDTLNIEVVACYYQTSQIPIEVNKTRKRQPADACDGNAFINELILTLYARIKTDKLAEEICSSTVKERIFGFFIDLVIENSLTLSYPRTITPEEMRKLVI